MCELLTAAQDLGRVRLFPMPKSTGSALPSTIGKTRPAGEGQMRRVTCRLLWWRSPHRHGTSETLPLDPATWPFDLEDLVSPWPSKDLFTCSPDPMLATLLQFLHLLMCFAYNGCHSRQHSEKQWWWWEPSYCRYPTGCDKHQSEPVYLFLKCSARK